MFLADFPERRCFDRQYLPPLDRPGVGRRHVEVQAYIVDAELADHPEPLLPEGRPYADLEKAAARILSRIFTRRV